MSSIFGIEDVTAERGKQKTIAREGDVLVTDPITAVDSKAASCTSSTVSRPRWVAKCRPAVTRGRTKSSAPWMDRSAGGLHNRISEFSAQLIEPTRIPNTRIEAQRRLSNRASRNQPSVSCTFSPRPGVRDQLSRFQSGLIERVFVVGRGDDEGRRRDPLPVLLRNEIASASFRVLQAEGRAPSRASFQATDRSPGAQR